MNKTLIDLLKQQFPTASFDINDQELGVGSFPEWDSLGTFNFLLLIEQTYNIRFSTEDITNLKTLASIQNKIREMGIKE